MSTAVEAVQEEVTVEDRAFPMEEAEVDTKVVDPTAVLLAEAADTKVVPEDPEDPEATEVDREEDTVEVVDTVEDPEATVEVLRVASVEALVETVCPTWVRVSRHKLGT